MAIKHTAEKGIQADIPVQPFPITLTKPNTPQSTPTPTQPASQPTKLSNNTPSSSTHVLKPPPDKPAKYSQLSSSRVPKPQRKYNLKAIIECYNIFHTLDEIDRIDDDPDSEQEPSSHSPT